MDKHIVRELVRVNTGHAKLVSDKESSFNGRSCFSGLSKLGKWNELLLEIHIMRRIKGLLISGRLLGNYACWMKIDFAHQTRRDVC
jgi:hypothetical protein